MNRSPHFYLCCSTNLECCTSEYPQLTISQGRSQKYVSEGTKEWVPSWYEKI